MINGVQKTQCVYIWYITLLNQIIVVTIEFWADLQAFSSAPSPLAQAFPGSSLEMFLMRFVPLFLSSRPKYGAPRGRHGGVKGLRIWKNKLKRGFFVYNNELWNVRIGWCAYWRVRKKIGKLFIKLSSATAY